MKLIYFWKPILWLAIICYALFIPADDLPLEPFFRIPHFDKMVHFGLFFVFCILLLRPFKKLQLKYYILAPLISILLSAVLEISQHVISNSRSSDIKDFIANSMGAIAAIIFYYLVVSNRYWEKLF
jgi:glycopeptide antibiotics resistance protein